MNPRLVRAVLVALALAAACAGAAAVVAAPSAAAADGGFVIVDEPDDATEGSPTGSAPPFARLDAAAAERIGTAEAGVATALRMRPDASVRVRFLPSQQRWRVSVRDRASATTLATAEIDDRTGTVVRRTALPLGQYPSQHTLQEAIDVALADPRVHREAREWGGVAVLVAAGRKEDCCWEIDLRQRSGPDSDEVVVRVDVQDAGLVVTGVWTGVQIPWKMARGNRKAFGGDVNERFVWLPLLALFALVVVDWTRLRSWANADVAAILALGVSHEMFLRGNIDWSVPLAVPPLLWLCVRMALLFARGVPLPRPPTAPRTRAGRLARRRVPTALIVVFCVALAGARIGLTLEGGNVIDVGYAGVVGARLEQAGQAPWGNMPDDVSHGDTYGPANYFAYLPAVALLDDPEENKWGGELPAAQATSIAADLGCALLLALIGWRWISRRASALLAAGWLACPWTTWALASSVNDALVALALLAAFAALRRPLVRGLLLGVASMVKFAPLAVLAPMVHVGVARRGRQAALTLLGTGLAVAAGLAWVTYRVEGAPLHDLRLFADRTLGFQTERGSPFSPWGLYGWELAQRVAQVVVVLGLLVMFFLPRARDAWQVAAGGAAALIALQLTITHWFYLYVPWFVGFVLLVLVAQRERVAAPAPPVEATAASPPPPDPAAPDPAPVCSPA